MERPHPPALGSLVLAGLDGHRERHAARLRVRRRAGERTPPFDFTILGTAVARYHLPELTLQGVTNLPAQQAPDVPYGGGQIPWGIRSVRVADGTVYLYGTTKRAGRRVGRPGAVRAGHGPERMGVRHWAARAARLE
ncbi:MAG: hypothetical protein ACJ73V_02375 [Acidimicrobiia bacterium]